MKKLFSCMITLFITLTFAVSAFAASDNFVPSISDKPAPETVIAEIIDSTENVIKEVFSGEIIITPISQADTSDDISDSDRKTLKDQYAALTADGAKLSEICPFLNDVAATLGEGKNADNLVIRDFMDISIIGDENSALLGQPENKIIIKLKNGLGSDEFVTAMVYVDGSWKPVKTVNNGDGTVTCTFDDLCPVAFLVEGTGGSELPPPTGSGYTALIWGAVAIGSLILIVILTKMIVSDRKQNRAA